MSAPAHTASAPVSFIYKTDGPLSYRITHVPHYGMYVDAVVKGEQICSDFSRASENALVTDTESAIRAMFGGLIDACIEEMWDTVVKNPTVSAHVFGDIAQEINEARDAVSDNVWERLEMGEKLTLSDLGCSRGQASTLCDASYLRRHGLTYSC